MSVEEWGSGMTGGGESGGRGEAPGIEAHPASVEPGPPPRCPSASFESLSIVVLEHALFLDCDYLKGIETIEASGGKAPMAVVD